MRDEHGMSLVELVVAMSIGIVVLLAAFTVMDRAFQIQKETNDRSDAVQRGRLALEAMTRSLRSQVCMGTPPTAIRVATVNSMTYTADLSGGSSLPAQYILTYDAAAKTITEYKYDGSGTYPTLNFPASPTRTRVLLTNVVPSGTTPIFSYWALDSAGTGANTALTSLPLSTTDLPRAVRVAINFTTRPTGKASNDVRATSFSDDVYARSADPLDPSKGLTCI